MENCDVTASSVIVPADADIKHYHIFYKIQPHDTTDQRTKASVLMWYTSMLCLQLYAVEYD